MTLLINNQTFTLHKQGVIFWSEKNILLISDVHLGKVAHFRKHGMAIPNDAIFENFTRLNLVVDFFQPETIIFLGDLFHSKMNKEWELFSNWIKEIRQEVILVEGNHDIIKKHNYENLNIKVCPELLIDDFLLTHHPKEREGFFNFCGHIHPGIKLKGIGRQYLNLSCFFQKPNQMILPAFGEFTGNFYLVPTENDLVYGISSEGVFEVVLN
ncbi:MAG: ligase-associated DNA damage response endonuclease PdeM [Flavobacterium sp.]|nr:ligase-associated DNA damage response endonuclease PdeM [Flavobacterium sp.]